MVMTEQDQAAVQGTDRSNWVVPDKMLLIGVTLLVALYMLFWTVPPGYVDADTANARQGLKTFEIFGLAVATYLLLKSANRRVGIVDLLSVALPVSVVMLGLTGLPVTVLSVCLFFGSRGDAYRKAAATVIGALAVQAVWAPIAFDRLSEWLLPLDAAAAGFALSLVMPGASWDHTIVNSPNGFSVMITATCSSFHNISLATLCWVSVTMMQRPYWVRRDLWIGALAVLVQVVCNVTRLVLVSMSDPMYQFWHEGLGRHVMSAVATLIAILIVSLGAPWAARKAAGAKPRAPREQNPPMVAA